MDASLEQFHALGQALYGEHWERVCRRNVQRISSGKTQDSHDLTAEQLQQFIDGMKKLKVDQDLAA